MRRQRQRIKPAPYPRSRLLVTIGSVFGALVVLLVVIIFFVPIRLRMHLAAMDSKTGTVSVYSFDDRSISVFVIPGDTIMTTAGNLGEWPAKSLWKLGHDEKLGGQLLSRSIIKTFGVPVTHWANPSFSSNLNQGFTGFVQLLTLRDTNLSFLERINVSLASLRGVNIQTHNLLGSSALEQTTDHGETRYIVRERLPVSFTIQFDEDMISRNIPTIGLYDGTDSSLSAQWLVKLVNVVGGKVVSRDRIEWDETCEIAGDPDVAAYFIKVLPCKISKESADPFDVKIKLGKKFTQVM